MPVFDAIKALRIENIIADIGREELLTEGPRCNFKNIYAFAVYGDTVGHIVCGGAASYISDKRSALLGYDIIAIINLNQIFVRDAGILMMTCPDRYTFRSSQYIYGS